MTREESHIQKIAITGGTGLIGGAVRDSLREAGHEVVVISRSGADGTVYWNPEDKEFDPSPLEGFDAVIHLAGEPIAKRWTGEVREKIYSSRVRSTRLLVDGLASLQEPPKVFLSASGINFYRPTEMGASLTEEEGEGTDFLSRVCLHWEAEAKRAEKFAPRVCFLRTSAVLAKDGGALAKMLPIFRKGAGGRIGSGEQPFPWVSLRDYVGICHHLLFSSSYSGPVNVVSPGVVSNEEFVKSLGEALNRPAVIPVPRTAIRLAFGEMGTSMLLEGVHAVPAVLQRDGFVFQDSKVGPALAKITGKE
tara:strand:- start:9173 stop:10090 length:918 start_codon:yes stop_codon:yes gene_type:complete